MKNLKTQRLILRQWKDSDIPVFVEMNRDEKVMEFFSELQSEEKSRDLVEWNRKHFAENGFGLFALELKANQEFIGFVGIVKVPFESHFTPAIEIGWRLASKHFGNGYATEAAREVLRFAFNELHLKEIVSFTVPNNLPSQNVMKKIGMIHDLSGDFFHPRIALNHKFSRHVLYKISAKNYQTKND